SLPVAWVRPVRCGRKPMVKSSSPTARTWKPRSTWAVFRYWNALTWMRRWLGRGRPPKWVGGRSRCARFFSCPTRTEQRNSRRPQTLSGGERRTYAASSEVAGRMLRGSEPSRYSVYGRPDPNAGMVAVDENTRSHDHNAVDDDVFHPGRGS